MYEIDGWELRTDSTALTDTGTEWEYHRSLKKQALRLEYIHIPFVSNPPLVVFVFEETAGD